MHIHLIAICGTAMGALAGMLKAAGHRVTGSDEHVYPPMSTQLAEQGISIAEGFDAAHLDPAPDLVVIGNAMSRGNPEVEHVLATGIAYTSMAAAIEEQFLAARTPLVVTGTHGKTTTTSLLAWLLEAAGMDPSFLVGGVPLNFGRGWKVSGGEHFVIEGDEYDTAFFDKEAKFLHYRPHVAIVTGVEFDHADIFDDLDAIKRMFVKFVALLPEDGTLLVAHDEAVAREVVAGAKCDVQTYGLSEGDWTPENVRWEDGRVHFMLRGTDFTSAMLGEHNLLNTVAALGAAHAAGLELAALVEPLASFRGIKRRQEVLGEPGGVTVIDDFAHHPTAVRATLAALKGAYGGRKLWAVFEPRTNTTHRDIFQSAYAEAFDSADEVVIAALYAPHKVTDGRRFDPERLVQDLNNRGVPARFIPSVAGIVQSLCQETNPRDLIVILSNGGFHGIHGKLLSALEARA